MESKIFFTVLTIISTCYCKEVVPLDFMIPCSVKDNVCIGNLWSDTIKHLATGREDLDLPPLDPLKLDNIFVDVPGLVTMKFEGYLKGFKTCLFENVRTSLKRGHYKVALDIHCNVSIKGHYDVKANSTILFGVENESFFRANGDGKVKIDSLKLKFLLDFLIIDDEGIVKFVLKDGPITYKYKINGPVVFAGNNMFLGKEDISPLVVPFINQNWKFVMDTFGGPFFRRAMEIVGEFERSFFKVVPASSYFIEDLQEYAVTK